MSRLVPILAVLGCMTLANISPAYADDCLPPPSTITGQLRIVETRHPNGELIRAFVVFVEDGQCVSVEDVDGEHANVFLRDVHLAPKDGEAAGWVDAVGKEVTAHGKMGLPFTAWHVGFSMMFDAVISSVHASDDE